MEMTAPACTTTGSGCIGASVSVRLPVLARFCCVSGCARSCALMLCSSTDDMRFRFGELFPLCTPDLKHVIRKRSLEQIGSRDRSIKARHPSTISKYAERYLAFTQSSVCKCVSVCVFFQGFWQGVEMQILGMFLTCRSCRAPCRTDISASWSQRSSIGEGQT